MLRHLMTISTLLLRRHGAAHIFEEYRRALTLLGMPYADLIVMEWAGSVDIKGEGLVAARYGEKVFETEMFGQYSHVYLSTS